MHQHWKGSDLVTWTSQEAATWASQPLWWSERQRSKSLLWQAGAEWFANDPLGPLPHSHPDAAEIYVVLHGTLELTVGRTEVTVPTHGFCLIPPGTYHRPHNAGETALCMLALVSPNLKSRRWKTAGFTEADYRGVPALADTHLDGELPGTPEIRGAVATVRAGSVLPGHDDEADVTICVLAGAPTVTVGPMSCRLAGARHLNVMAGSPWAVAAGAEDARVLVISSFGNGAAW